MSDPTLFDVTTTQPQACPVPGCGSIRLPGQNRVPTCVVDLERATEGWQPRPKTCLNTIDPAHATWPEGF